MRWPVCLFDGVDPLDGALRPVLAIAIDVFLLREAAEGVLVRRVDLLALLLEELDRLLFLRIILGGTCVEDFVGL